MSTTKMLSKHIGLAAFALTAFVGCVNDQVGQANAQKDAAQPEEAFWQSMLAHYSDNIVMPALIDVEQKFGDLAGENGAVAEYCQTLDTADEATAKLTAQIAWRAAMSSWQQVELMQFGPLSENEGALRNQVYSYQSSAPMNACSVDQSVILSQQDEFNIQQRSNGAKGLAALEYLLFNTDLTHQCAPQISVTQDWNQLPELTRKQQRCSYALKVANDVTSVAERLQTRWSATGENYRFQFTHPSYIEDRLNAISDALFYIEIMTKDRKLGVATGIHNDCTQTVCPTVVESPYSDNALNNIKNNLMAFRTLLNGGDGIGFDDEIIRKGFAQTVEAFNADITAAVEIIDSTETPMLQQLEAIQANDDRSACDNAAANPESPSEYSVCRLHGMIKRITDRLRTDFVAIVNLDLPDRAQSDND